MQNTTNFNLNKPEGTDVYNIQNENDNMDIIDAALAKSYFTDDSASTELANADYLPFYDTSASEKKKMLLSTARNDVRARIAESVSNDVIETIGGTALNSYSVGQYFLGNDGYYYVATSAITAGSSTISTGVSGNCSKTSIAAGMNSLTSQISNLNSALASKITSDTGVVLKLRTKYVEVTPSSAGFFNTNINIGGIIAAIPLQNNSAYVSIRLGGNQEAILFVHDADMQPIVEKINVRLWYWEYDD